MGQAVDPIGIKEYAARIGKSYGHVVKQCRAPHENGRRNFLDEIIKKLHANIKSGMDTQPLLQCICEEFGFEAVEPVVRKIETLTPNFVTVIVKGNNDELHRFLEGIPETLKTSLGFVEAFNKLSAVEVCDLFAAITGKAEVTVFLKPSKVFHELVATMIAGKFE
ncbi:MAG: hypothetical protein ACYSTI_10080 [Planctomycetota bacterium]